MLTAAGCAQGSVPLSIYARAGSNNYMHAQQRIISTIIIYPGYNPTTGENDIAVVKALQPFWIGPTVQTIPLGSISVGSTAIVSGWGATSSGSNNNPANLRFLDTQVISNEDCQSSLSECTIFSSQVCTSAETDRGVCRVSFDHPIVNIQCTQ